MKKQEVFFRKEKDVNRWKILLFMKMSFTFLLLVVFQLYIIAAPQHQVVTGKVTDSSTGEPITGVTVVVLGTTTGTYTGIDGTYSITAASGENILHFSFVGYITQEIQIGDQSVIDVALVVSTEALEEIVVVGYGTTTRQTFTGSVTTVNVEDSPTVLSNTTNAVSLLRGITTGVTLSQDGEAGTTPSIEIRGDRSIFGASSAPLIVLDGVIFNGGLNDLDPNNIKSLSVLKDASTLAIYGSRAANGVIMVTTKRGKIGKPVINFQSDVTLAVPGYEPKMRDGQGYIQLMNYRSGLGPDDPPNWWYPLEEANYNAGEQTDWIDYIDRTGVLQNYSLSFSGASQRYNYYLAASHLDQQGQYYGDDYARNSFTGNISTSVTDWLEIGVNTLFSFNRYEGVSPSYGQAITLSPWTEPELLNGDMRKFVDGHEPQAINPLWDTYHGIDNEENGKTSVLGGYLDVKVPFISGLSYKITGSYTTRATESRRFTHETNFPDMALGEDGYTTEVFDLQLVNAEGTLTSTNTTSWVLDNILTYIKQIGSHNINATLVYTRNSTRRDSYSMTGSNFTGVGNTTLGIYGLPSAEVQLVDQFSYQLHNDVAYMGRIIYSFMDKYNLSGTVRRDGSSVFGVNKKWGVFPAIGGAWTISEENFMANVSFINNLKLKASWGKNGDQSLSPYGTLSTIAMGLSGGQVYYFDDQVVYGQRITALGNSDLGWVSTASFNYGFEADLLNRFHIIFDMYQSKTTDQIFSRTIPVMGAGITSQNATMGQVDNWGIETELTSKNIQNSLFSWTTSLFFTLNRNKLVELYGDGQDDITRSLFLGKSLDAIYGYRWDGVVQEGEENYLSNMSALPGDAKYADLDHDNELTADDREILGYNKDNFRLSMVNTFTYKNFEAYVLINGVFGGGGYGLYRNESAYITNDKFFYHNTLDHPYWTPTNPSDIYPRWDYVDWDKFVALQSITFIRLQDISISYRFNRDVISRIGVNGLRVYVSCSNLACYAPEWEGSDPEIRSFNRAQLPRSFKFGLNVQF